MTLPHKMTPKIEDKRTSTTIAEYSCWIKRVIYMSNNENVQEVAPIIYSYPLNKSATFLTLNQLTGSQPCES